MELTSTGFVGARLGFAVQGATFQALAKADLLDKLDVSYYNEFN